MSSARSFQGVATDSKDSNLKTFLVSFWPTLLFSDVLSLIGCAE